MTTARPGGPVSEVVLTLGARLRGAGAGVPGPEGRGDPGRQARRHARPHQPGRVSGHLHPAPLARIYLFTGEPAKALDQLEPLVETPYYLSPGWLRIVPTFAPLKGNPRFEKLVAGR